MVKLTNYQENGVDIGYKYIDVNDYFIVPKEYLDSDNGQWYQYGTLWTPGLRPFNNTGGNAPLISSPTQIGTMNDWRELGTGYYHCLGIRKDGTAWAWGNGDQGILGNSSTITRSSPVQVGSNTDWYLVSAGGYFSGGINTKGQLWLWGTNTRGELAQLNNIIHRSSPVQIGGGGTDWKDISFLGYTGLALKTTGQIWSWGINTSGEMGDNTAVAHRSSPVQIGARTDWKLIAGGSYHAFAITTADELFTWGLNTNGQLGQGNRTSRSSPVQLTGQWKQAGAGYRSSGAVKWDGTLWTWGYNGPFGALGQGDYTHRSSPLQVGALTNWEKVLPHKLGYDTEQMTALKMDGTLWAWGDNWGGQLGQGDIVDRSSPIFITYNDSWLKIVAGEQVFAIVNSI